MARKKIVLVIVEGPSDDVALGMALNQVYDKDSIYVHIMHGDITTKRDYKESWRYIEKDLNSVNRHTNLCICIEEEIVK